MRRDELRRIVRYVTNDLIELFILLRGEGGRRREEAQRSRKEHLTFENIGVERDKPLRRFIVEFTV